MTKIKFFLSILKERDWLEDMARQGWLLNNINMGIVYHFTPIEPCEKVYEVERFAITSRPTVTDLTAKARALDITSQFGWQQVTHDENMNYYFVKDKAGDETDEFYDTPELRLERAGRYRQHHSVEGAFDLLKGWFGLTFLYILLFIISSDTPDMQRGMMWLYIILTIFELLCIYGSMKLGQQYYTEFSMSRSEWEQYKKHRDKKYFNKVQQLRSYLQEKSEFGLSLKCYEDGHFIFEEDTQRYNYFVDTRTSLKKRLKLEGKSFEDESKDIQVQSLKWYETSIANASQYGLYPVAVIDKKVLIYKRPYSDAPLPWENGNENIHFVAPPLAAVLFTAICFAVGFAIGALAAFIS